jgi:hypothetical protein
VTTNANLTGEATSVGNAATLTNSAVIGKVLTGYVSGAGTVAATDSILQAIQKLNGNAAGATGTVTSVSVVSNNGFAGTVATDTTTPAITLTTTVTGMLKGSNVSGIVSAGTSGTDYSDGTSALATGILKSTTATGALTIAVAADFPTLNQDTTGTAAKTNGLNSATTVVDVSSATAPTVGQYLIATSSTAATWQTPAGGGVTTIGFGTTGLTPSGATSGVVTVAGTLAVANGGTGVTAASTGTGGVVLSVSPTFTGTPLSTTAASGTNTTQIATTAFAYGTLSNATSGYVKLPNGLILQWGTTASLGSPSTTTITLPITFPSSFHNVTIARNTSSLAASYTAAVVKGAGRANFTVYNNGIACAQMWAAVGI